MFCDYVALGFPLEVNISPDSSTIHSCNGIVCISYGLEDELCLWNPSIHKMMTLPPVTFQAHNTNWYSIGFGFDSLTDDYKVIRIVYLRPNFDQNHPEVEIFSLRTGTWRNITHLDLPYTICKHASQAYVKGTAHWLAWDFRSMSSSNLSVLIVSFHMGDEVFGEIMLPNGMPTDDFMENVRVAKFQESLCD
ncbi:F-box/kelch-repeat protein At3g06240-like [Cornus florida]|uniref:F-box/kelch-repeat protein At3g06240-like n=1 Tax=Cornus florida TaxID=4283 RepID=UPI00289E727E|nr:F-box/kelch-repeat protein At3g06240-like [Cornus florida]